MFSRSIKCINTYAITFQRHCADAHPRASPRPTAVAPSVPSTQPPPGAPPSRVSGGSSPSSIPRFTGVSTSQARGGDRAASRSASKQPTPLLSVLRMESPSAMRTSPTTPARAQAPMQAAKAVRRQAVRVTAAPPTSAGGTAPTARRLVILRKKPSVAAMPPPVPSLPPLPPPPAEIDIRAYDIVPDETTIIYDRVHNLPALGIIINAALKVVICVDCQEGIEPASITNHVKQHNKYLKPSSDISEDLQERYGVVSLGNVTHASAKTFPIFGIPIERQLLYFCSTCHRGYNSPDSLRGHQSNGSRCFTPLVERQCYRAFGQKLTNGPHKRYFPVDTSRLSLRQDIPLIYSRVFETTLPPPPNPSSAPVQDIEDEQNLGSFLFREGWLGVVKDITPADIQEAVRLPDEETEPWGRNLQLASHRALAVVQGLICKHHGFGLTQLIAQVHSSLVNPYVCQASTNGLR